MTPRHFRSLIDLAPEELIALLDRAAELKRMRRDPAHPTPLAGRSIAVILEKASTRTRVSFDVGIHELGGHPITLVARDTQLARGEPVEDTARMISRYVDGIVYRTSGHERVEAMARAATVPIVNGLSDLHHPCQLLADLQTVRESTSGRLEGVRVAWVGDGNNMASSWIEAASMLDFELVLACPEGYEANARVLESARARGRGAITTTQDVDAAVRGADVVTTDVFASMGQEDEAEARRRTFADYMVDERRMELAKESAIFLHCLPAHRGEEVSAGVIDGRWSRVWDEAENRLHSQKALLEFQHVR